MSAIAGTFGFGPDGEALARRMGAALAHRGPDGEDIRAVGNAVLVHRQLAMAGPGSADQSVTTSDGRWTIVLDGAIHNQQQLRAELAALGQDVRTGIDAELVLAAHIAWGAEAYDRLTGRFALAIHDAHTDTVTLARDHIGIAPLYYWSDDAGRVLFASDMKALLATEVFTPEPDDRAIYRYLALGVQDDDEHTLVRNVTAVLPGQMVTLGADGVRTRCYTRLQDELRELASRPGRPYTPEVAREIREWFEHAVHACLPADVPVGTALLGGLDTAAAAAVIARDMQQAPSDDAHSAVGPQQNTFSAAPAWPSAHARTDAAMLREQYGELIGEHSIRPTPDALIEDLTDLVRTQDQPMATPDAYTHYAVMREAAEHVTVLLDGPVEAPADHLMHLQVRLRELRAGKRIAQLARETAAARDMLFRAARQRRGGRADVPVHALLDNSFVAAHKGEKLDVIRDNLRLRLLDDLFRTPGQSRLRSGDRNAMRFGIERRVPILDKDLLRFLMGVDSAAIVDGQGSGRILRDAVADLLPEAIRGRRDVSGHTAAEPAWFSRCADALQEIFASPTFAARRYVDAPTVQAVHADCMQHPERHETLTLWRLASLELWMREFLDPAPGIPAPSTARQPAAEDDTQEQAPIAKSDYEPNDGKQLDLVSAEDGHTWRRFPLQTDLVGRDSDLEAIVRGHVERFLAGLPDDAIPDGAHWYFVISEKIVAITQGRSWYTWEVAPRRAARLLSRFVTRTPAGIGLGDPTTMELAMREVGVPRIMVAAAAGAAGKVVGRRGVFYEIVGANVRAIDGPTVYSAFPSNVSAKLPPKDPDAVSARLSRAIRAADAPAGALEGFSGVVVMDANDIGRNVLGTDTQVPYAVLEATFADNPLGQGRQRTPMAILVDLGPSAS